jgi:hypothetical protein
LAVRGHFPAIAFRGKAHHRSHYALQAVGLIRAGVAPDIDVEISWWFGEDSGSTDAFQCGCRSQTADGPPFYAQIAARRGIDTDECPVIAAH